MRQTHFKWINTGAAACCVALLLAGCGDGTAPTRETIQKPDKTITVVEPGQSTDTKVAVSQITQIDRTRGISFITDEQLVIVKRNENEQKIAVEGEMMFPNNLYLHDLATKQEEALHEQPAHQGFAKPSPDGKYLFYKLNNEESAHGYMMNLETRESVELGSDVIDTTTGMWMDDTHVLFMTVEGKVIKASVDGALETILSSDHRIFTAVPGEGGIYYVVNEVLYFLPDGSKQAEKLATDVVWVIPSPERKQLALVKRTSNTTRTLMITDAKGNEPIELGSATQVFGTSWSPDGKKLAYSLTSEGTDGDNGVFVADAISGDTVPIKLDVQYLSDDLGWSPSGKKIVAATYSQEQNDFITFVITLK
ncbi:hypothetical protein BBD42_13400 [Paenibacillus sp. BIHB 4019]|uniref:TolB protein n=1 Tax=Paenibacillus sp. BIHB 4019 TaxID=1870819 RepID=A0A1B2DI52_9BACL|nr:PD40 domain-containing protein [Paenibacillus sp. BIHB 4019]ANY67359.1 hypothetical protein BBD42_13400 [Paenibacillus sp. BIHB 4019]